MPSLTKYKHIALPPSLPIPSKPTCKTSSNFNAGPVPPNPPGPTRPNSAVTAKGGGIKPAAPCSSQVVGVVVEELEERIGVWNGVSCMSGGRGGGRGRGRMGCRC